MSNKQYKLLKYIYKTPKTIKQIKKKFHYTDDEIRFLLGDDDGFDLHFYHVKKDSFDSSILQIRSAGEAYVETKRHNSLLFWFPVLTSIVLSAISIGISL